MYFRTTEKCTFVPYGQIEGQPPFLSASGNGLASKKRQVIWIGDGMISTKYMGEYRCGNVKFMKKNMFLFSSSFYIAMLCTFHTIWWQLLCSWIEHRLLELKHILILRSNQLVAILTDDNIHVPKVVYTYTNTHIRIYDRIPFFYSRDLMCQVEINVQWNYYSLHGFTLLHYLVKGSTTQ